MFHIYTAALIQLAMGRKPKNKNFPVQYVILFITTRLATR